MKASLELQGLRANDSARPTPSGGSPTPLSRRTCGIYVEQGTLQHKMMTRLATCVAGLSAAALLTTLLLLVAGTHSTVLVLIFAVPACVLPWLGHSGVQRRDNWRLSLFCGFAFLYTAVAVATVGMELLFIYNCQQQQRPENADTDAAAAASCSQALPLHCAILTTSLVCTCFALASAVQGASVHASPLFNNAILAGSGQAMGTVPIRVSAAERGARRLSTGKGGEALRVNPALAPPQSGPPPFHSNQSSGTGGTDAYSPRPSEGDV